MFFLKNNVEKMREFLKKKKEKEDTKQNYSPNKKIGSNQRAKKNIKTGGSNNKV